MTMPGQIHRKFVQKQAEAVVDTKAPKIGRGEVASVYSDGKVNLKRDQNLQVDGSVPADDKPSVVLEGVRRLSPGDRVFALEYMNQSYVLGRAAKAGDEYLDNQIPRSGVRPATAPITSQQTDSSQWTSAGWDIEHTAPAAGRRVVRHRLENSVAGGGGGSTYFIRHEKSTGWRDLIKYDLTSEVLTLGGAANRVPGDAVANLDIVPLQQLNAGLAGKSDTNHTHPYTTDAHWHWSGYYWQSGDTRYGSGDPDAFASTAARY